MYTSADEDRSDLFLAAAVYVLGPELLGVVLGRLPGSIGASPFVSLVVIVLTTIAVPLWLMRYRKQRVGHLGFDASPTTAGAGLLVALPVALGFVLAELIARTGPLSSAPVFGAVATGAYVAAALSILRGLCVAFLVIYATVKARTAFRADPAYIKPTMLRLGKFTAIAGAAVTVLLLLTVLVRSSDLQESSYVALAPVGIAAAAWLTYRWIKGSQLTSRATLLTPMILLAIGAFVIFARAAAIVAGLWQAALLAGIGLIMGALLESRRSAWSPLGFALGVTLLTPLL